jgi:hypothetical protein
METIAGGPGQIAYRAGYDGHKMTARGKVPGEFVMASPTGFVKRGKGLMDKQDVH